MFVLFSNRKYEKSKYFNVARLISPLRREDVRFDHRQGVAQGTPPSRSGLMSTPVLTESDGGSVLSGAGVAAVSKDSAHELTHHGNSYSSQPTIVAVGV
jgi:hypothetical protein